MAIGQERVQGKAQIMYCKLGIYQELRRKLGQEMSATGPAEQVATVTAMVQGRRRAEQASTS